VPLEAQLVLAVLFGVAGWHHARHLERKYGSPAWGMPSWLWGVITGFSLLLGVILLAVAERGLKKAPVPPQVIPGFVPMQATAPVQPVLEPVAAVPAPVPAAGPPAGWHPDPSGKFHHRWWDGQRWTADVSTNGVAGKDV
jgi:hypothetical protein